MACFCMLSIASLMVMPAGAVTERNWTGADSANWSDPNNWSPIGVPQNGDELLFGYVDDSNRSMVNDLTGLGVLYLSFANNDYQIDGNSLTVQQENL